MINCLPHSNSNFKVSLKLKTRSSNSAVQFKFQQQDDDWENVSSKDLSSISTCFYGILPSRGMKVTKAEYFELLNILISLLGEDQEFLQQKGIFRVSGKKSKVDALFAQLSNAISSESFCSLTNLEKVKITIQGQSAHDLATLLKQMFQKTPFPLISCLCRKIIVQIVKFTSIPANKRREMCFAVMPNDERKKILEAFFCFLSKVARNAELNLMNVDNLSIVFAPVLFAGDECWLHEPESLGLYVEAIRLMIVVDES
jgi:hypothetical protein